ncbi:hypothetical protein [Shouchella clausii]|uniref:hypothetical protein n=1 Tax=Shouchella clausii TaxID=79880 RepID=UPI0012FE0548|nr:hypothetical protein [Shouchella clausii]
MFNQLTDLAQGGCRTHLGASYIMTSLLIELSEQLIASYASPLTKRASNAIYPTLWNGFGYTRTNLLPLSVSPTSLITTRLFNEAV